VFELACQVFEQSPRTLGVTACIGPHPRAADTGAQPLGERLGDIRFLLAVALSQCAVAEDLSRALRAAPGSPGAAD
jgi:hypothetical protein